MKLYEKLQKLRKEHNYSQEQLADLLNVSRQTISKWENGTITPTTDRLQELCNIYQIPLSELLGETEPQKENSFKIPAVFSKVDKRLLIGGGILAFALFIALLVFIGANIFLLHRKINTLQDQVNFLKGSVQNHTVYTPDYTTPPQNSLLSSFDIKLIRTDIPANAVVFKLSATPKEFHENDIGEFILDDGTESKTLDTELKDGTYQTEFSFPRDSKSMALFFKIANGKDFQTESLGSFPDIYGSLKAEYNLTQFPEFSLSTVTSRCYFSGALEAEITPAYDNTGNVFCYPENAVFRIKQNDKIIKEIPIDIDDIVEQITSTQAEYSFTTSFWENMEDISIKVKDPSQELTFDVVFTDNWGIETIVQY